MAQILLSKKASLVSAREHAQGRQFSERMKTDWTPPAWAAALTEDQRSAVRKALHVIVQGKDIPPPVTRFTDFKLPRVLLKHFEKKGIGPKVQYCTSTRAVSKVQYLRYYSLIRYCTVQYSYPYNSYCTMFCMAQ